MLSLFVISICSGQVETKKEKISKLIRIRNALFKIKTYFLPENLKKFFRNKTSKKLESRESEWERKQEREKDRERDRGNK